MLCLRTAQIEAKPLSRKVNLKTGLPSYKLSMPFITMNCIKFQYDLKLSGTVASQAFIKSLMLLKLKNSPPPHPF